MTIPKKKLKTSFEMPVFGFGTWQMGGRTEHDPANDDDADIKALQAAIEGGITHIDTAEVYADGYTETLIAKAIKNYDRSKLFLVSKVQGGHLSYEDITKSCEGSLKRLETDYLDLYLLHRYNPAFSLKDSMKALDQLVEDGLIKNIGVSNFTPEHLAEAQSYTSNKVVCNQVHYNLEFREPERKGLSKYCQENDVFLVAWRPVGKGNLLENVPTIVKEMCEKYQKSPAQIAINWLISQPYVLTLAKTRNIKHLQENLGAIGWQMEDVDIEKLRTSYPDQKDISDTAPLG